MSAWGVGKTLAEQLKEKNKEEAVQPPPAVQPWGGIHSATEEKEKNPAKKEESQSTAESVVPPTMSEAPAATAPLKEDKPLPQENKEKKGKGATTSEKEVVRMPSSWAVQVSSSIHFSGSAPAAAAASSSSASASIPQKKGKGNGPAAPAAAAAPAPSRGKGIPPKPSSRSASSSSTKRKGAVVVGQNVALSPSPSSANPTVRPTPFSQGDAQPGAGGERSGGGSRVNRRNRGGKWRNHQGGGRNRYYNSYDFDWDTGFIPGGEFGAIPFEYHLAKEGGNMHPQEFYNGFSPPPPPPQHFPPFQGGAVGGGPLPYHPSSFLPYPPHPASSHGPYAGGHVDYTIGHPCFGNPSILPYSLGGYEHPNGPMGSHPGPFPPS